MSAVGIPAAWGLTLGVGLGILGGCVTWLTCWAGYALPAGLTVGALGFVVGFLTFTEQMFKVSPDGGQNEPEPGPAALLPSMDPILLDGRPSSEVTPEAQAARELPTRWESFVKECAIDTERRRLEKIGYSRGLIKRWRALLLRAEKARWKTTNHRGGWELTATVETILGDEPLQNDAVEIAAMVDRLEAAGWVDGGQEDD